MSHLRSCENFIALTNAFVVQTAPIYLYFILHICFCWFCHIVTFFWQIVFPFHARTYKIHGRNKFLYIAVLVPSLVLPTAPAITAFATGGFAVRNFPPLLCATRSEAVLYYTLALPMSVMTGVGVSLLILIISELIKVMMTLFGKSPFYE